MKRFTLFAVLSAVLLSSAAWADPLPYTEGSVWSLSFVKVKYGFGVEYLRSLQATWKKAFDQAKKDKLVLSYKVLSSQAAGHDDWDLLLMVEHKNMAALDGFGEKMRDITLGLLGGEDKSRELQTKRLEIREVVADKLARELIFK